MNGVDFLHLPKGLHFFLKKNQENIMLYFYNFIFLFYTFPCNGRLRPIIIDIICLPQRKHNKERDGGILCFRRKKKLCL